MRSTMKITHSIANTYGYISIAFMVVLLIAVYFELVPRFWYYPLFAVALTLYMIRLTMRLVLAREARLDRESKKVAESGKDAKGTKT
jgi:hypothetical protein